MNKLQEDREREWRRAMLATDILAERKSLLTITPEEYRLFGGNPAKSRASRSLDQQLRYAMMQLDLASVRLHSIALSLAKNADELSPIDDDPTQP